MNLLIGREYELSDGSVVKVKMAQASDYGGGTYERLYRWLCEVDEYLTMRFDAYDMEDMKQRWLASLGPGHVVLIALDGGEIVGQLSIMLHDPRSRTAHIATLGIAIRPDYQRRSLGTVLYTLAEQLAHERGLEKLECSYFEGSGTEALTRKLGYVEEGRRRKRGKLDSGRYVDEVLVAKFLD